MENINNINQTETNLKSLVPRKTIAWIAYNYKIADEIKIKFTEKKILNKGLKSLIMSSPLAWWCERNTIILALDSFNYIKVAVEENDAKIIEFETLDESTECKTVLEKMIKFYTEK